MENDAEKLKGKDPELYGTFPQDQRVFEWEDFGSCKSLLIKAAGDVGRNMGALGVLYWTLLRGDNARKNLMHCDPFTLSTGQVIGCEYTKAYLRAFPLLGISITLAIALRMMVQQRVYYGLLKAGGLLDFENVPPYHDPLFLMLLVSLLHGVLHFWLKLTDGHGNLLTEVQDIAINFIVPYVIFLAFFSMASDREAALVPLSKYYEEDPEYARNALASITFMEEDVVRRDIVKKRDVVGAAIEDEPTIDAVYRRLIAGYPKAKEEHEAAGGVKDEFMNKCLIRKAMWPGLLLVDIRLQDDKAFEFRMMLSAFLAVITLIQGAVFFLFLEQAIYKDLYLDAYMDNQTWDVISSAVLLLHAAVVAWIVRASWWMVLRERVVEGVEEVEEEVVRTAEAAAHLATGMATMAKKKTLEAESAIERTLSRHHDKANAATEAAPAPESA